jgi:hypothetical protein
MDTDNDFFSGFYFNDLRAQLGHYLQQIRKIFKENRSLGALYLKELG